MPNAALPDEPWHVQSLAVLRSVAEGELQGLVAPTFAFELRSTLARAAQRRRIPWDRVGDAIARLERLELEVAAEALGDRELLEACRAYGISWAAAHPVVIARRRAIPLITADARLIRALRDSDVWVESILDRPPDTLEPGEEP